MYLAGRSCVTTIFTVACTILHKYIISTCPHQTKSFISFNSRFTQKSAITEISPLSFYWKQTVRILFAYEKNIYLRKHEIYISSTKMCKVKQFPMYFPFLVFSTKYYYFKNSLIISQLTK